MDELLRPLFDACPPLIIFFIALCLFIGDGCLPKIVGIILIPIGIIALIVWFFM